MEMGFIATILTSAPVLTAARPMQLAQTPTAHTCVLASQVTLATEERVSISMNVLHKPTIVMPMHFVQILSVHSRVHATLVMLATV